MKKRLSTQQKISRSLFTLMKTNSYQTIQVKQICKRARISRMTFYRHFHSKNEVINYSLDRDFTRFIQRIASIYLPSFTEIATIFFKLVKERQVKMQLIITNHLTILLLKRLKYYIHGLIKERVLLTRASSSRLLVATIAGGLTEILVTWTRDGMRIPIPSLVIFVSKYLRLKNSR